MKAVTVLMYHAVADGPGGCAGADAHYTVSRAHLRRHLDLIAAAGLRARSVASLLEDAAPRAAALTFDDGHESNAAAAADILARAGSADLFVNPSTVGTPHYLGWTALRELASAGISIQSHGYNHRYLDELDDAQVANELASSKAAIEDRVGQPVTLFAPPGGRLTPRVAPAALRLGYRGLCSSRAGIWRAGQGTWSIPRLAVLAATGDDQFRRWLDQDRWEVARMRLRHGALAGAKALLGNRGYERLRGRLLGRGGAS